MSSDDKMHVYKLFLAFRSTSQSKVTFEATESCAKDKRPIRCIFKAGDDMYYHICIGNQTMNVKLASPLLLSILHDESVASVIDSRYPRPVGFRNFGFRGENKAASQLGARYQTRFAILRNPSHPPKREQMHSFAFVKTAQSRILKNPRENKLKVRRTSSLGLNSPTATYAPANLDVLRHHQPGERLIMAEMQDEYQEKEEKANIGGNSFPINLSSPPLQPKPTPPLKTETFPPVQPPPTLLPSPSPPVRFPEKKKKKEEKSRPGEGEKRGKKRRMSYAANESSGTGEKTVRGNVVRKRKKSPLSANVSSGAGEKAAQEKGANATSRGGEKAVRGKAGRKRKKPLPTDSASSVVSERLEGGKGGKNTKKSPSTGSLASTGEFNRVIGERLNSKDKSMVRFSANHNFAPQDLVVVPRSNEKFTYATVVKVMDNGLIKVSVDGEKATKVLPLVLVGKIGDEVQKQPRANAKRAMLGTEDIHIHCKKAVKQTEYEKTLCRFVIVHNSRRIFQSCDILSKKCSQAEAKCKEAQMLQLDSHQKYKLLKRSYESSKEALAALKKANKADVESRDRKARSLTKEISLLKKDLNSTQEHNSVLKRQLKEAMERIGKLQKQQKSNKANKEHNKAAVKVRAKRISRQASSPPRDPRIGLRK
ncbi:hypothetical protein AAMO2058_001219900 [Amorphochlora amoebiformis]